MDIKSKKCENLPKHIAIIMDGNGRWAKKRKLVRIQGHLEGMKRVEEIIKFSSNIGLEVLTLFTFSSENWNRPKAEVTMLMNALAGVLSKKKKMLTTNNIRFQTIGRIEKLPKYVKNVISEITKATKKCEGMTLNLALNYGSRMEIEDAVKSISSKVKSGMLQIKDINEKTITNALYTKNLPDPDLLIRTSGEKRISNFLLWQLSYAELYFTDKFWPEFTEEELTKAIVDFQKRERRFGSLNKR